MTEGKSPKPASALSERLIAGLVVALTTAVLGIPALWVASRCAIDNRFDGLAPSNPVYQVLEVFCPLSNESPEAAPQATSTLDLNADELEVRPAEGEWAVQISTDGNEEGACWEVSQAGKEDYRASAYRLNETTYITLVGQYASEEDAEAHVEEIKRELTKSSAWPLRIPSDDPIHCP